jgi:SPP1 gp7 family putative phage head morphogenesis protein
VTELERQARNMQRLLLALENTDAASVIGEYQRIRRRLETAMRSAARAASRAAAAGGDPLAFVREDRAVRAFLAEAQTSMNRFAEFAADTIEARQAELVQTAQTFAKEMAEAQTTAALGGVDVPAGVVPAFRSIPTQAVASLVGSLGDGTALSDWSKQFGEQAARKIGEQLITGVTNGEGAAAIGRRLRSSLDGNAARALTVGRTETLRAYRNSTTQALEANPAVISGWEWYSRTDVRTCPSCWAMHGTFHKPEEVMGTHPNCRCIPLPKTKSVEEILGFNPGNGADDMRLQLDKGADMFKKLDEARQRQVLGPAKFEAYKAGRIKLEDLVAKRTDKAWGVTRTTSSLKGAEARAARRGGSRTPGESRPVRPTAAQPATGKGIKTDIRAPKSPALPGFLEAVETIKKVHDPEATLVFRAVKGARMGPTHQGVFLTGGSGKYKVSDYGEIAVKNTGSYGSSKATSIHEIGHALDFQILGEGKLMGTKTYGIDEYGRAIPDQLLTFTDDHPLNGWAKAVNESGIRRHINAQDFRMSHINYLLKREELFARSYEQWIAIRSGEPDLLEQIAGSKRYWPEDTFGPIAAELDKIFGVKPK